MRGVVRISLFVALVVAATVAAVPASAGGGGGDTLVTVGSPVGPFSQNKQNEPAVAVDQAHTNVLAAGSNDNIDMELCNAGPDEDCPFTPDIGGSGIYFSFDSGASWTQPTYTGLTARGCTGAPGDADPICEPEVGPIGTLPNYYENGLVSDGDPALAFGPAPGPGGFSYDNGSRLYYANLTSALPGAAPFKGFEAIAVSHTDDVQAAAAGDNGAWSDPVIASKQNSCTVLRQGADLGRQRGVQPALRQRVRLLRRASAAAPAGRSRCSCSRRRTVATAGSRSRSRRQRTTPTARTDSGDRAARSGPTRTASCTCSTTSSRSTH